MNFKTTKITYFTVTIIFALSMLGDAYGGITKQQAGVVVMNHLGYPVYLMPMLGIAKLLGAVVLLIPGMPRLKEWAYAGFAFNFISAVVSRSLMGDAVSDLIPPLVMLGIMFASYFLWKSYYRTKWSLTADL